jgi:hypothetical protein
MLPLKLNSGATNPSSLVPLPMLLLDEVVDTGLDIVDAVAAINWNLDSNLSTCLPVLPHLAQKHPANHTLPFHSRSV